MHRRGAYHLAVVVEDDDSVREIICELLEYVGFRVVGCRDGPEGLIAARDLHPSVLTLDLQMPGMDGVEVLERLTRDEATATLPVVIVSAHGLDRGVSFGRQVKAVLPKPFDADQLCETVLLAAIESK